MGGRLVRLVWFGFQKPTKIIKIAQLKEVVRREGGA